MDPLHPVARKIGPPATGSVGQGEVLEFPQAVWNVDAVPVDEGRAARTGLKPRRRTRGPVGGPTEHSGSSIRSMRHFAAARFIEVHHGVGRDDRRGVAVSDQDA